MQILPCAAPIDSLESAPLTDMSLHISVSAAQLSAFWGANDRYYLRALDETGAEQWFEGALNETTASDMSATEAAELTRQLALVLPLATGKPAFAVGSSGRTVYRVWRTQTADNRSRTRIRAVRAGQSRRQQA